MAIPEQQKFNINQSNDSGDYKAIIHRDALYLIIAGQERMVASGISYCDAAEEDITGELARYTDEYINSPASEDWTKNYYVHDELHENTNNKKGKYRPRVDIVCILTGIKPQERMKFEAKRLKKPGFPVRKYVGKTGLGEFISGNYAPECDTAGMLGYVQSDDCDYWSEQISNALNKKREVRLIKGDRWQKTDFENINDCYKTRHNRLRSKGELLVYHLLLDFALSNAN